jgi:ribose-phosphate pyrophosphokinase
MKVMERTSTKRLHILSGTHTTELANKVAKKLGITVDPSPLTRFANGEVRCQLEQSVRGADVFVFQTHSAPVNDAIMEQAVMIDAAKRASARSITAVCPFFGYARQDRKASGREPISARLVTDLLAMAGADRIVSIDLHSGQTQGFFDGPFDHLIAMPVLVDHLKKMLGQDCVVVSPDAGRVKLAERYVSRLGADLAIVHKRREKKGNGAEALHLIGDVKGRHCVIIDDMIDGGGTMCAAADQLKNHGAKSVVAVATHGLFSEPADERFKASSIDHIAVTDTLPLNLKLSKKKVEVVSIADLLAEAISIIFEDRSLSALFDGQNQT